MLCCKRKHATGTCNGIHEHAVMFIVSLNEINKSILISVTEMHSLFF